ncbi:D-inositol 3-phosphate glycosyltransferase [Sphaerisporangium krabiense]|uniref:D-inositol-3-phosphate glycosyltransferase n=2 Tax=Sphaerisporangium krabiense TaxID=763782 RepID=A0A7W8Z088_9ACTN|nr:D-inositol-3-phosphate glycosyltransferase [Sphaerisporangium krabiense]MBB5625077.1 D-inositol-3-phosphate glycosyltransferase [Sphaerisporangium krabiense]GII67324.1 D-inositol 3-phosphate glycosyltransferase [Sphaerisporangium krabiense]
MPGSPVARRISRIATISMHTSPLDQPGTGDAGGMNVYVVEVAKRLADLGVEVEIFTRQTARDLPPAVELTPGVTVRHVTAGPYEELDKGDLPGQLCDFLTGVLRTEAMHEPGHYDLIHSHYWLSGQVGWLAKERWGVPLVHTMHTMAKVKNVLLAKGDRPEPAARVAGEEHVVEVADRLVANTDAEARELIDLYGAPAGRVAVVNPGVNLEVFQPASKGAARHRLGLPQGAHVMLFVGRIQPLKAPDVLLRAAARMLRDDPSLRSRLVIACVGGPSGNGLDHPSYLTDLAAELGISDVVRLAPPAPQQELADWYRAADVTVVPSYNESFGLVALESQACGTPVAAAKVGGLRTAVKHGVSGLLVDGHEPHAWAAALRRFVDRPLWRDTMAANASAHAARFGWPATAARLMDVYTAALARHRSLLTAART